MKKRSTAIFLALFLGSIGIHHFYLHNRVRGFIYLTLSWTLMPLIASWVDALILLNLTDEQFHTFYNLATIPNDNIIPLIRDTGTTDKINPDESIFDRAA